MKSFILYAAAAIALLGIIAAPVHADDREPAVAGRFYPAAEKELEKTLQRLIADAGDIQIPSDTGKLRALVMPHAGYPYSGPVAAHAAAAIPKNGFDRVIVIGPDHRAGLNGLAVSLADAYLTPLGRVPIHPDARNLKNQFDFITEAPRISEKQEHSIEVILPFLQQRLDSFTLIPLVAGRIGPESIVEAVSGLLNGRTLLVASSDLSHFLPYEKAVTKDRHTVDMILDLDDAGLLADKTRACGIGPVSAVIQLARQNRWQPVLLDFRNSGDTAGDKDRVVGYAAIAFFDTVDNPGLLDPAAGRKLVTVARQAIFEKLGLKTEKPAPDFSRTESVNKEAGTFVTLKIDGRLRGCIGNIEPKGPIPESVKRNAVQAAFHDPRFPALTREEARRMTIEVSVLTKPEPLEYKEPADLLRSVRKGVDGVIIQKGHGRATYLPQVWEQLPKKERFLSRLCMKAGLSSDAWQKEDLEVFTYQVRHFESEN